MLKTDEAVVVDVAERKKSAWASTSASSNQKRSRRSQVEHRDENANATIKSGSWPDSSV